jgi:GTPase Era involved in 16S rRNA processing
MPLKKPFDVLVVATMSAGKSSFINAMIGRELLHTANEATTACVASVEHWANEKDFHGFCYSHAGHEFARQRHISSEQVRAWNANMEVNHIRLAGKFNISPRPAPGLVFHDTPGANNSQDDRHAQVMLEAVRTSSFKMLLYVLNAGQLETLDDCTLLERLCKELALRPQHQIVFILNKVDLLDPERGEVLTACVRKTKTYLESIGFDRPVIVPTMADAALCARKALNAEPLTRVQRWKLHHAINDLKDNQQALLHTAIVPDAIRRSVLKDWKQLEMIRRASANDAQACETLELRQLVAYSGIRTVETLIKNQRRKAAHS